MTTFRQALQDYILAKYHLDNSVKQVKVAKQVTKEKRQYLSKHFRKQAFTYFKTMRGL